MKYYWTAKSDDGAYESQSTKTFDNMKDAYDDMRDAALEKMKWNTQYDEDFSDMPKDEYIGYEVKFKQDCIEHTSYSGTYTYKLCKKEDGVMDTLDEGHLLSVEKDIANSRYILKFAGVETGYGKSERATATYLPGTGYWRLDVTTSYENYPKIEATDTVVLDAGMKNKLSKILWSAVSGLQDDIIIF